MHGDASLKFPLLRERVMLLSIWKGLHLYQICKLFLFIVVTNSLTPYIHVQAFSRTLLIFMISYGNEFQRLLVQCMNKQKIPLVFAHAVFAAFQAPWTSSDSSSQEMYFCHVLLIQLFIIYIIVLHAEVFADLLSASSSVSERPLVWLFLFSPEQSSMSQLLSSVKLALLHHFSSWRSGQ